MSKNRNFSGKEKYSVSSRFRRRTGPDRAACPIVAIEGRPARMLSGRQDHRLVGASSRAIEMRCCRGSARRADRQPPAGSSRNTAIQVQTLVRPQLVDEAVRLGRRRHRARRPSRGDRATCGTARSTRNCEPRVSPSKASSRIGGAAACAACRSTGLAFHALYSSGMLEEDADRPVVLALHDRHGSRAASSAGRTPSSASVIAGKSSSSLCRNRALRKAKPSISRATRSSAASDV